VSCGQAENVWIALVQARQDGEMMTALQQKFRYYALYWLTIPMALYIVVFMHGMGFTPEESSIIASFVWVILLLLAVLTEETMRYVDGIE
jgi:TRAP-type C4-dicarboxylate transport system permease large subunit